MAKTVTSARRDPDTVRGALHAWLPSRLGGHHLDALTVAAPDGHGFSNDTFIVEAIVDGAPMPLVVQAAPTGPGLFPEYSIGRIATVLRDLREHSDVPVAKVRWLEEDAALLGAPFYVMDRVEGRVPDESPRPYHAAGWIYDATREERRELWLSMLDAMARLHRLDVAAHFPYLTQSRWGVALEGDAAAERVRQWREYTVWASEDDPLPTRLMDAWDVLDKTRPPRPEHLSIGWGDAKLGNLMCRGFQVAALFDWELVGVGPAEEDLMNQLAVDAALAHFLQVPRVDGFLSREETLATYEGHMQRELIGTQWWYAFALAKMAAEMHRIMRQSRKLSAMPADLDLEAANRAIPLLSEALGAL